MPQLRTRDAIVPDQEILGYLKASVVDLDVTAGLTKAELAQSVGFESLVRNELSLALKWSRWGEDEHFYRVTRKQLVQVMPFPLNYAWVWAQRHAILFQLKNHPQHISSEEAAQRSAKKAYEALSEQLGTSKWMFGDTKGPSTLDCIVFGHIMEALREPIGSLLVARHPNLVSFCERIQKELFDDPEVSLASICSSSLEENMFARAAGFNAVYGRTALEMSSWGEFAENEDGDGKEEEDDGQGDRDKEFQEGSRNAILFAGGVVATYLLFSNVVSPQLLGGIGFSSEDDDDDEDA